MTYDIKEPNKISVSKILEIAMRENKRIEDGEDKIEFIHPWVVIALAECLQKAVDTLEFYKNSTGEQYNRDSAERASCTLFEINERISP